MRDGWTDERMDDFRDEVNRRFDEVNLELRTQRAEMRTGFAEINRTMLRLGGGAIVTIVVGFAGMIATQL